MTLNLALAAPDAHYLAADSASLSNWTKILRRDRKIETYAHGALTFSHSYRMGQIVGVALEGLLSGPRALRDWRWGVREAVPLLRERLSDGGALKKEHAREDTEGKFFVATRDSILAFFSDNQVSEVKSIDSSGCGWQIGIGALAMSLRLRPELEALEHLVEAMRLTARWCTGVYAPYFVAVVPRDDRPVEVFAYDEEEP